MHSARDTLTKLNQRGILKNLKEECDEAAQNNSILKSEVINICSANIKYIQHRAFKDLEKIIRLQTEIKIVRNILSKPNEIERLNEINANPEIVDKLKRLLENPKFFQNNIDRINSSCLLKIIDLNEPNNDVLMKYQELIINYEKLVEENKNLHRLIEELSDAAEKMKIQSELEVKKVSLDVKQLNNYEDALAAFGIQIKENNAEIKKLKEEFKLEIDTFKDLLGLTIVPKRVMDDKVITIKPEFCELVIATIETQTSQSIQVKTSHPFLNFFGFCEIDKNTIFIYGGARIEYSGQTRATSKFHIISLNDLSVISFTMTEVISHAGQCLNYKGSIFIFGGFERGVVISRIQVYHLGTYKLTTRSALPFNLHSTSASIHCNQIFIAGYLHESIVIYSPDGNTCSTIHVTGSDVTNKVLLNFFGRIYIISCKTKSIFFSIDTPHRNFMKISHIFEIADSPLIATPAQRGNCFYFVNANRSLYRFSVITCELVYLWQIDS